MFWGLIMEPSKCYTQIVKNSYHISMAAIDIMTSSDEPSQVMCSYEGRNYLLCTLDKQNNWQCHLDLNFEKGSRISFAANGKAHVHLTGYLIIDEDITGEDVEEEEEVIITKENKRTKKNETEGPPKKKTKIEKSALANSLEEAVEEEEYDSDFKPEEDSESEDASEEENEEEEGNEEEESDSDEEEEADFDEESSLDEEEEEVKLKQNGLSKKHVPTPMKQKKKENEKTPEKQKKSDGKQKKQEEKQFKSKKQTIKGGIIIEDLREGSGEVVKDGKTVNVYYEGRLKHNNKLFDSSTKGPGFSFKLGKNDVIKGWDLGLIGMKVGGKRRITCPPKMAYGLKGSPPVIPPNATLVFDIELKKVI